MFALVIKGMDYTWAIKVGGCVGWTSRVNSTALCCYYMSAMASQIISNSTVCSRICSDINKENIKILVYVCEKDLPVISGFLPQRATKSGSISLLHFHHVEKANPNIIQSHSSPMYIRDLNLFNTVAADGRAPEVARPSATTVWTLQDCIYFLQKSLRYDRF